VATLQDLINQERRGAVVVTRPLSGNGSVRDAGAVGLGEKGALSNSFGDLSEAQRIYQGVYNSTGQTFRPETWRAPGSTGSTGSAYGGFGGIAGSGTGGAKASDALARDKFNYDKQQDALKLGGMQSYYDSGSANKGFDALLKMIGDQGTVSENAVKKAYDAAITNVDQGYGAAQGLADSGYDALNKYLSANQNDPYAGMQATVGSAPDALTQYLSAYGVSDQPVQGQIKADQLQAQQGAGNYQNLINLLSSVAQSGASSRGAESAMGQNLFNTTLGQERAGYKTRAEMAQADAMRQIQQIMYEQRMAQESSRNAQMQQLAQALAAAGGQTGSGGVAPAAPIAPVVPGNGNGNGNSNGFVSTSYDVNQPVPWSANPIENIQLQNLATSQSNAGQTVDPYELLDALNARRGR
jgi:hypothetical protein